MKRNIVEHGLDALLRQFADQTGALLQGIEQNVIHMGVMHAIRRNAGAFQHTGLLQRLQGLMVHVPPFPPLSVDLLPMFQLGI